MKLHIVWFAGVKSVRVRDEAGEVGKGEIRENLGQAGHSRGRASSQE